MAPPDDLARWQGAVDARLDEVERRTDGIAGLAQVIADLRVDIATLRAQVKFWSALATLGGAGCAALIAEIIVRSH